MAKKKTAPKAEAQNAEETELAFLRKRNEELFTEARTFGGVNLFTSDDGKYSVNIAFQCIPGTELKAKSGFGHDSPHAALMKAIENAKEIRKAFVS